jgi:hypothetical protein
MKHRNLLRLVLKFGNFYLLGAAQYLSVSTMSWCRANSALGGMFHKVFHTAVRYEPPRNLIGIREILKGFRGGFVFELSGGSYFFPAFAGPNVMFESAVNLR